MKKRVAILTGAVALTVAALLGGCSPSSDLGGLPIPNVMPDTRITGEPPNVVDAGFQVRFYWTGHDPDGKIIGYQWKMSENGPDGIDVADTLTVDPATGKVLHPWHTTTVTDSTFIVTADLEGFPGDSDLPSTSQRSYQVHTLFVRALDDEGGVDPTPAYLSFTATTLLPTVRVDRPNKVLTDPGGAPRTVSIGYVGTDPDFELNAPTKVRYLWKPAIDRGGRLLTSYAYINMDPTLINFLASFSDSAWGAWIPYGKLPEQRMITFRNQPEQMTDISGEPRDAVYLFAIQAMDTTMARSLDRTVQRNVLLVQIDRSLRPLLVVTEQNLGMARVTDTYQVIQRDIAQGQVMQFNWSADASSYGGTIAAYRYGWDLDDPDDPNDPAWAVMPGNTLRHRQTDRISWDNGVHTLTVQTWDNSDQPSRCTFVVTVVPVPPPASRRDVLLVDAVPDRGSRAWETNPAVGPVEARDEDNYRDEFWNEVLSGPGGLVDFDPGLDVVDCQVEIFNYRRVVEYKSLLWTTRLASTSWTVENFQPLVTGPQYIWLVPYQEAVGNLFLVGSSALSCFIEPQPRGYNSWMLPWIFTAPDDQWCSPGGTCWGTGFGTETLPDGTERDVGPQRYPYKSIGISLLDRFVPDYVYAVQTQKGARKAACVGLKGVILDNDFSTAYMPEGIPFPTTILGDPEIDWKDSYPTSSNLLNLGAFFWEGEEFYDDGSGSDRATAWQPQICDGEPCIDTMWRTYTRYDFANDQAAALGNTAWPFDLIGGNYRFSPYDRTRLNSTCGSLALRWSEDPLAVEPYVRIGGKGPGGRGAGVPVGFVSHKLEQNKPTPKGDVVWGFDPYRFDREQIKKAIRWVLGEHFGLAMKPSS